MAGKRRKSKCVCKYHHALYECAGIFSVCDCRACRCVVCHCKNSQSDYRRYQHANARHHRFIFNAVAELYQSHFSAIQSAQFGDQCGCRSLADFCADGRSAGGRCRYRYACQRTGRSRYLVRSGGTHGCMGVEGNT